MRQENDGMNIEPFTARIFLESMGTDQSVHPHAGLHPDLRRHTSGAYVKPESL